MLKKKATCVSRVLGSGVVSLVEDSPPRRKGGGGAPAGDGGDGIKAWGSQKVT